MSPGAHISENFIAHFQIVIFKYATLASGVILLELDSNINTLISQSDSRARKNCCVCVI